MGCAGPAVLQVCADEAVLFFDGGIPVWMTGPGAVGVVVVVAPFRLQS